MNFRLTFARATADNKKNRNVITHLSVRLKSLIHLPSRYAVTGNAAALTIVFNAELAAATATTTTRVCSSTSGIATNGAASIVGR